MHKRILLIPDDLDNIDIPKRPHFLRYLVLTHLRINVWDIHRPGRIIPQYGVEDFSTHPRLFSSHIDVQSVSSDGDLLDLSIGEEGGCDCAVEERDKETLTILGNFDLFKGTKVDQAQDLVDVGSCRSASALAQSSI